MAQQDKTSGYLNPYHFVRLGSKCNKQYSLASLKKKRGELITGWIDCDIILKSPIFIPGNITEDKNNRTQKICEFFNYGDVKRPVIPGSSIRGMVRSVFETITNSCLSTTDMEQKLHKRFSIPYKNKGILKQKDNKEWVIIPCNDLNVGISCKERNNDNKFIYFSLDDDGSKCKQEIKDFTYEYNTSEYKGLVHLTKYINKKKLETVFVKDSEKNEIPVNIESIECLKKNYELYKENHKKNNKTNKFKYPIITSIDQLRNMPVYYESINQKGHDNCYYLSPANIGRKVFFNTLKDILDDKENNFNRDYTPCKTTNEMCAACCLFGFINDDNALGSRVSFSDASLKHENKFQYMNKCTLNILSSPHLSSTEFYFERINSDHVMWTIDYYQKKDKQTYDYNAKIMGRKYYWHQKKEKENKNKQEKNTNIITPLAKTIEDKNIFSFKVNFKNITDAELQALICSLNLGSNVNKLYHKIGMAKPLGYGSIKIKVNNITKRFIDLQDNNFYRTMDLDIDKKSIEDIVKKYYDNKSVPFVNNALNLLLTENKTHDVKYPTGGFRWFSKNRVLKYKNKQGKKINRKDAINFVLTPIENFTKINDCKLKK